MLPSKLPVDNSTTSFWRSNPLPLDDHRSTPELPAEVDIAIIGAGYAGSSTAYHILKAYEKRGEPLPSIVILEARQACSGATGRNGGHLKPDPYSRATSLAKVHGKEAANEAAAFEAAHLPAVSKTIEDEKIDCDFVRTRCCDVFLKEDDFKEFRASVDALKAQGLPFVEDVYTAEGAEAEQLSGVMDAKGCFTYTTGHLWPYKLIHGLLARAVAAGVNLQTNTPVTATAAGGDGKITISTARGTVRAGKVVYATNGYTSAVLPEYVGHIVPVRGICSHIAIPPAANKRAPHLPFSYIVRRSSTIYEYLISRLDGSIVVGGGRNQYYHDLESWYNNVNDNALIDSAKTYFDGYMQRTFYGWEDSGAETTKVWTGIMGYSTDNMPHVGAVPGRSNQYIVAGFTGHGMPQVFLSARGVAEMVANGTPVEKTGVPLLYQASQARLDNKKNAILDTYESIMARNT